jgi:hypothetical protein
MKKITITISLLGILIGLSSCGGTPGPQFYNGNYYWIDSNCVEVRPVTATSIECRNSDKVSTGYRNAMTDQQMDMYRHNQQMEQQRTIADSERRDRRRDRRQKEQERFEKKLGLYSYP